MRGVSFYTFCVLCGARELSESCLSSHHVSFVGRFRRPIRHGKHAT